MERKIAAVVEKVPLRQKRSDLAYWLSRPPEERIAAVEEIRREYHGWLDSTREKIADVQPGFQRVYRIIKLK